jgi:hypothetical protein
MARVREVEHLKVLVAGKELGNNHGGFQNENVAEE